jgi:hypothetical protein
MDLKEIGWEDVDWNDLAQDRAGSCKYGYKSSSHKGQRVLD